MKLTDFSKPKLSQHSTFKKYFDKIDSNRYYSNFGPLYKSTTKYIENYFKLKKNCVVLTSSGHSSILALFLFLKQKSGKKNIVLVPNHSFHSNLQAIILAGFVPKFYQYEPEDEHKQEVIINNILNKTKNVAAINFVSCLGKPIDIDFLNKIQETKKTPVIYDAADTYINFDRNLEKSKILIASSFHPTKNLPSNETGMIVTNIVHKDSLESIINFGIERHNQREVKHVGFNGKCSEYNAAILLANLKRIKYIKKRLKSNMNFFQKKVDNKKFIFPDNFIKKWISQKIYIKIRPTKKNLRLKEKLISQGYLFYHWTHKSLIRYKLYQKTCKIDKKNIDLNYDQNKLGICINYSLKKNQILKLIKMLNQFENLNI